MPVALGQAVFACNAAGACLDTTSPSATGPHTDTPLGWLNGEVIYQRIDAQGSVAYRAISFDPVSRTIADDRLLGDGGSEIESLLRPYPVDGGFLVLARETWLFVDNGGLQVRDGNPYGEGVGLIRIDQANGELAYVAGGELVIASLAAPGTPLVRIPFSGSDFALAPDGQRIVLVTGAGLEVVGRDGQVLATYANPDGLAIGGVAWTTEGILVVDASSGQLRLIDPET